MRLIKSVFAGMFIGLGATAFLLSSNALVFTIGIFLVLLFTSNLITGYVPLSTYQKEITFMNTLTILIGNLLGSYLFGLLIRLTRIFDKIKPIADTLIEAKMNDSLLSIFIMAVLCVALIGYGMIGTLLAKGNYLGRIITLLFPTYIFVVMGLEHIVANMFYISISLGFNINTALPLIITSMLGNIVGGLLVGYTQRKFDNK